MKRGFTLLEMLVAALVLSIGLLGALEVISRCAGTSRAVQDRALGLMFARSKMEEILKEPVLQTGTDRGQGVDESTEYDWEVVIEPSQNPSLVLITASARHRTTGVEISVSALRRPDLQTPPEMPGAETTGAEPVPAGSPL